MNFWLRYTYPTLDYQLPNVHVPTVIHTPPPPVQASILQERVSNPPNHATKS